MHIVRIIARILFVSILFIPASTVAFHDGVPLCPEGAVGYWATVLIDGKKMALFLSKENPPSSETIFCSISPDALIQVKATGKDM